MKLIFLHADKHQSFLQVNFNTLGIKVSYKVILSLLKAMIKHSQITQSNKFGNIFTIPQKRSQDGVHFFHADKYQSFYKWTLSFWIEVARHVQSTQNRMLVIYLQYPQEKSVITALVFYCDGKYSDIFQDLQFKERIMESC